MKYLLILIILGFSIACGGNSIDSITETNQQNELPYSDSSVITDYNNHPVQFKVEILQSSNTVSIISDFSKASVKLTLTNISEHAIEYSYDYYDRFFFNVSSLDSSFNSSFPYFEIPAISPLNKFREVSISSGNSFSHSFNIANYETPSGNFILTASMYNISSNSNIIFTHEPSF